MGFKAVCRELTNAWSDPAGARSTAVRGNGVGVGVRVGLRVTVAVGLGEGVRVD
jgi:hypothetical protein